MLASATGARASAGSAFLTDHMVERVWLREPGVFGCFASSRSGAIVYIRRAGDRGIQKSYFIKTLFTVASCALKAGWKRISRASAANAFPTNRMVELGLDAGTTSLSMLRLYPI